MPILQTAHYQVRASAVDAVKSAIAESVEYITANEPGTQVVPGLAQRDDPTRFTHVFIFANEAAQIAHSESDAVKKFESVYGPELVSNGVQFIDFG